MISLSQAFAQWQELAANIPQDDGAALAESWNNYTDSLCKDGELCGLQYHYAPSYDDAMPGTGHEWDVLSYDRRFIVDAMGLTLSATFVPFSQSRNKDEKHPSLNWRVTLKLQGKDVLTADYTQGSAHCPAHKSPIKHSTGKRDDYLTNCAIARECETGKRARAVGNGGYFTESGRISPPELVDVLHCFLTDASVLDCRDFADWAGDMGMDTDSIKARNTYDACVADALKLRGAIGEQGLRDLRDLFEGM